MGGGMGGMGGGMGGMGMGGMGGGMGGMGMGGMGFGSVPPKALPAVNNQNGLAPQDKAVPKGQALPRRRVNDPEVEHLLNRILDKKTSQVRPQKSQPQWFAQIQDGEFRLNNKAVEDLKKKAV
jgi:hypothetical protein